MAVLILETPVPRRLRGETLRQPSAKIDVTNDLK
jgi:hypothetical protein